MNKKFTILAGLATITITITCLLNIAIPSSTNPDAVKKAITIFAGVSAILIIFATAQGIAPNNAIARNIITLLMLIVAYSPLPTIVIGGTEALLATLTSPILSEAISSIPNTISEVGKILTAVKQLWNIGEIQLEEKLQPAYIILLATFLIWTCIVLFSIARSTMRRYTRETISVSLKTPQNHPT